ncbi:MAG TPA: hydrogenase maturation protease [Acidimicrobiales bacterium]|jgi:hydrogenase maturation protease|nr:hydrogenase maturation protease [Acidimicrobiales bacterium]
MSRRVLVAGIGNIFLSDDGFGVEVVNGVANRSLPPGVQVADFGIRGVHLAYELLEGYDGVILVDAVPMKEPAGTVAVIEPDPDDIGRSAADPDNLEPVFDAHNMSPELVLSTLSRLGGSVGRILVVGCQPATLEEGMGLSPPVAAAVDDAAVLCLALMTEIMQSAGKGTPG